LLKNRHQLFVALFVIADAVMIAAATYAAWAARIVIRSDDWPTDWEDYIKGPLVLFTVPLALVTFQALRLYRPQRDRRLLAELGDIVKASVIASAGVVLFLWIVGNDLIGRSGLVPATELGLLDISLDPARIQIGALAVFVPLFVGVQRVGIRIILRQLRRRGFNLRHVAVIGTGRLGQNVTQTLHRNSWTGLRVAYFISHHEHTTRVRCVDRPVLGGLDELDSLLERHRVDAVYLALPARHADKLPGLLRRLERFPVNVRIVPDLSTRYTPHRMQISQLEDLPILSYRENPAMGIGGVTKRLIDIVGALVGLAVFSPLLIGIGLAVRLGSPGKALYKQSRISVGGDEFKIYKFRTMRAEIPEGAPRWTSKDDPRITRIGAFLRKTSLDELPQFFNVLRGEMSLVGPRPERPQLIEDFRDSRRRYMIRQHVKAGMTGWAQVNGLRGDTCLRKRLQYDLFYIRNWSICFDIRILFATFIRGFVHRNAH